MKLTVSGYLESEIGLGQAARNYVIAAEAAGLDVELRTFFTKNHENQQGLAGRREAENIVGNNICVLPLPNVGIFMRHIDQSAANILVPYWEVDYVDPSWLEPIASFKEIWAPTGYIAKMLEGQVSQPIIGINQPVLVPDVAQASTILSGPLRLLTYFDVDSFPQRKNPGAAVMAFKQAFSTSEQNAQLTIKLRGNNDRGFRAWLNETVSHDPRIKIIDRTLPRAEMDTLIADCHVFLSLHRAEGFGFGAAEAMAAGKAVVATDYSGTKDFVSSRTGYPVPYTLQAVKPGDYLCYAPGQQWAWPNVNAAAEILRRIERNRFEAKMVGAAGRKFMIDNYGLKAVGETMKSRLLEISGENV